MSNVQTEITAKDILPASRSQRQNRGRMRRRECIICCLDHAVNQYPRCPHPEEPDIHTRDVCLNCWKQHLQKEIETKSWNVIGCAQCDQTLEEPQIRKLASSESYRAWLDKAARSYQQSDAEFVSCPSASCKWGCFVSTREDGNIFSCQLCKCRSCILCQVPMHENETCQAYQQRHALQSHEERLSEVQVKKVSKPCPKCRMNLHKYAGCDHVTCSFCSHEFCWICFAPYRGAEGVWTKGNAAHRTSCRYHSRWLPTYLD